MFAAEIDRLWRALETYLNSNMARLEDRIEERFAARQAAGEPDPIYRSRVFNPAAALFNSNAKST